MESAARPPSMAPAAFVYAAFAVVVLAALPHLATPLDAFRAAHAGRVLLGQDPVQGLLWGLGLGAVLTALSQGIGRATPWGRRLNRLLARHLAGLHPVDAVLLAGLSALAEELVFRSVLLPYTGLVASSALFGAAHLVPRSGLWPWAAWAAGAGLALGGVALATDGILAPLVAHFTVNAVGLLQFAAIRR